MPLFRIGNDLHYFAHVPKCGGASVEAYLAERFGPLALLDTRHYDRIVRNRWSRSSPQHIPAATLARFFPRGWIASAFAVVRDPLDRLVSAYNHCVDPSYLLPPGLGIEEWFDEYLRLSRYNAALYDNHLRPQGEIVPEDATWFRLEEGFAPVVAHIDRLAGDSAGPREIGHERHSAGAAGLARIRRRLPAAFVARVAEFYAADYARFGYAEKVNAEYELLLPAAAPTEAIRLSSRRENRSLVFRRLWRSYLRLTHRMIT
ncbi:MAG: sulfotransferase family 2 domain-containing protein [Defluviimonas sp.]|uniref:sulfotransferase family 2 domain-containing protein n=1 Tax=Albidovulum sp. TaxID=1872424 RepID=UPI002A2D6D17|nr:sulfotransferase family 2 domain-containing protein [Defluviimonas sp.]